MIDEYVRIYDDVVPPDFCDDLVNKFEASSEQW